MSCQSEDWQSINRIINTLIPSIMCPRDNDYSKDELDNHSNQLNPNNDAYWQSRDEDERPEDWEDKSDSEKDDD